ncbi:MAG TPA: 6-phosphogluconolactonase [Dissulfurispiraceae bacterium]
MSRVRGALVEVLSDPTAVGHRAAEVFLHLSQKAVAAHGRLSVALSGGRTPGELYGLLGSEHYREKIGWERIHFFWADERCVPKEDEASNFRLALETFLSHVPVPSGNIHRIRGEEGAEKAASDYEADLRDFFGTSKSPPFDLIILGVGEDGHTASLFPGSKALEEKERPVVPVYKEKPQVDRVTLTLPVLNHAAHILFLVTGDSKTDIVCDILGAGKRDKYPAGLVSPADGSVLWLLDRAAADKLK